MTVVDVGDVVGLVFAIAFAILVLALCFLLVRLTKVVDELKRLVVGSPTRPCRCWAR